MKKPKSGSAEELSALIPGEKLIKVRVRRRDGPQPGEYEDAEVRVIEMDITQIARVGEALAEIHADIANNPNFMVLAAKHPAAMCAAMAAAIDWPVARVAVLHASSFVTVATAIIERNESFFVQLLGLLGFAAPTTTPTNGAGRAPSPTSGATGSKAPSGSPSGSSSLQ